MTEKKFGKKLSPSWLVVLAFFAFILFHQTDALMIGSLTSPIMETFNINEGQMGAVSSVAILVAAVLYPIWGYLFDHFARAKLLSLASAIWGITTMFNASAPNYNVFLLTRASTGIDDSSYPGMYSLISDYFPPTRRGKIFGILSIAAHLGSLIGLVLALFLAPIIGWRSTFFVTGGMGLIVAIFILVAVREPKRGQMEPELQYKTHLEEYKFSWKKVSQLFKNPTLIFLFLQGFFGVFPWAAFFWIVRYLQTERGFNSMQILITSIGMAVFGMIGNSISGVLSDFAFKRNKRGRMILATVSVLLGMVLLNLALRVPLHQSTLFSILMAFTALIIPMPGPNTASTVYDITLPEVKTTAQSMLLFIERIGSATAPLIAGIIAVKQDLGTGILTISTIGWSLCGIFLFAAILTVPKDIQKLRDQMEMRAHSEDIGEFNNLS